MLDEATAKSNYKVGLQAICDASALRAITHFGLKKAQEGGSAAQKVKAVRDDEDAKKELVKAKENLIRARDLLDKAEWDNRKQESQ